MYFQDRRDAGRRLAEALQAYRGEDTVVYALPRGGVVLGTAVAKALNVPLDLVIARKVGHPLNPEYAICAVTERGHPVCNEEERAAVDPAWFAQAVAHERREAERRRVMYFADRHSVSPEGKTAILIDDGIATGLTMRAAIEEIQAHNPRRVVVAIPVIPRETAAWLRDMVDDVVALDIPAVFLGAVGAYYADFTQVTDADVIRLLHEDPALLFTMPPFSGFTEPLLRDTQALEGRYDIDRFANRELFVRVRTAVKDNACLVLGTITPPDEYLVSTLLLCDTLRREGAARTTLLAPYLAYMRQDRREPAHSLAAGWVARLLQASGVEEVVTVDIHSRYAAEYFPMPLLSLSPAPVFAETLGTLPLPDVTLVAPDEGAVHRCEDVRAAAGVHYPIARFTKERTPEGVRSSLQDPVGSRAVVIDDILDTGGTLVACCDALRQAGAREIVVMVTHGLFTGEEWQRLWSLGVTRIYCTDTVPLRPERAAERIHVLSIRPLLIDYIVKTVG